MKIEGNKESRILSVIYSTLDQFSFDKTDEIKAQWDKFDENRKGNVLTKYSIMHWCKKENVKVHALNEWINEIIKIIDIRIQNFSLIHTFFNNPKSIVFNPLKRN